MMKKKIKNLYDLFSLAITGDIDAIEFWVNCIYLFNIIDDYDQNGDLTTTQLARLFIKENGTFDDIKTEEQAKRFINKAFEVCEATQDIEELKKKLNKVNLKNIKGLEL